MVFDLNVQQLRFLGTDKSASVLLCYKGGRTAQLVARSDCKLPNNAVIYGTNGTLEVCLSPHPCLNDVSSVQIK
jgi:hypothetical protein